MKNQHISCQLVLVNSFYTPLLRLKIINYYYQIYGTVEITNQYNVEKPSHLQSWNAL